MKIVIWVLCILVYSAVSVLIREAGIVLGGIPTALLGLALVFGPAPALCKAWDKHKKKRAAIPEEKWYTCQKCGQLVREGDVCDCAEAEELQKAEKLGMAVEQYRAFREDIESNVAEKRLRDAAKTSERDTANSPNSPSQKGSTHKQPIFNKVLTIALAAWVVFYVVISIYSIASRKEPVYCPRCSNEIVEAAECPCCSAVICSSCLPDIENELDDIEKSGYGSGLEDGASAGYEDGYKDGYEAGVADGYAEGCYDSING